MQLGKVSGTVPTSGGVHAGRASEPLPAMTPGAYCERGQPLLFDTSTGLCRSGAWTDLSQTASEPLLCIPHIFGQLRLWTT